MMDLNSFRVDYIAEIKSLSESNMISDRTQFVENVASLLVEIGELRDFESTYYSGNGKGNRKILIDGYNYNAQSNELSLIIAEYDGINSDKNLVRRRIDKLSEYALNFLDNLEDIHRNAEESSQGWQFADYLKYFWKNVVIIKIVILSDLPLSDVVKTISAEEFQGREVRYSVWGMQRIQEVELSKHSTEPLELNFDDYVVKGVQALHANIDVNNEYDAYLAIISGDLLASIYHDYGDKLLEGNVRSYLSNRVKVNRAIKGTLINAPSMFFAYNNGIAATAENVEVEKIDNAIYIKKVRNLQIVNGGQTTASIFNAKYVEKKADLDKVFVPMKLSIVNEEKAEKMIPKIAETANTQNPVKKADFFSNHPFHIRMETISNKIQTPALGGQQYGTFWFYERARGQYNQKTLKMTMGQKKSFQTRRPKRQVIKKVDLAKYFNTYYEKPHVVSKGAQGNFMEFAETISKAWDSKDTRFNEAFYKKMVVIAIIFKHLERLVSNSDWYQKAFRANIVTYSIAIFFNTLRNKYSKYTLNYEKIWLKQEVPYNLNREFERLTYKVFIEITKEESHRTRNITEWAKKKEAWREAVTNIDYDFYPETFDTFKEKGKTQQEDKDNEKEQKHINNLNIHAEVVNKGQGFWKKVLEFGLENRAIAEMEISILKTASKMNDSGKIPTEKQSKRLYDTLLRLENEGFHVE